MQNLKDRFRTQDGGRIATLQSCIRTNDLSLVGDGTHLTYFELLGNFSFGNNDYEHSVDMWSLILHDLNINKDCVVHYHSSDVDTKRLMWERRHFPTVQDEECIWSDGDIGGTCCEVYWKGIEIGNLVNPLGHSTDVGFGWERLVMAVEGKDRVDETSLFNQSYEPIVRDHIRALDSFWKNGIDPGNKGRNYVCRRLLRRILPLQQVQSSCTWFESEALLREKCLDRAKKMWKRHKDKLPQFWWDTYGLTPDDLKVMIESVS